MCEGHSEDGAPDRRAGLSEAAFVAHGHARSIAEPTRQRPKSEAWVRRAGDRRGLRLEHMTRQPLAAIGRQVQGEGSDVGLAE